ncbi:unnamed protein product [Wickerhamomyces anomalus]
MTDIQQSAQLEAEKVQDTELISDQQPEQPQEKPQEPEPTEQKESEPEQTREAVQPPEQEKEAEPTTDEQQDNPVDPALIEQEDQNKEPEQPQPDPISLEKELSEITETFTDNDSETVIRNGIPIPKDSALFQSIDISYNPLQNLEISPSLLIKANLASLPLTLQAHDSLPIRIQFLIHSIPLLDNLSTQILRMIGVGPYEETLAIITSEEPTPEGLVYKDLVELFEQVKRVFSEEDPFLGFHNLIEDVDGLDLIIVKSLKEIEDSIDSAFRKTNLATFLLATLGSIEVGFFYLNESFLDVFCPTHNSGWFKNNQTNATSSVTAGKLLKAQAALFLELKTQAYISALESGDRSKIEVLEDIFPDDLKDQLLERRKTTELSPAEQDFLLRCKSRRETLLTTSDDQDLSEHYEWLIFLKELFNYVSKNIGFLIWGRKGRHTVLTTIGAALDSSSPTTPNNTSGSPYASLSKDELQKRLEIQKEKERQLKERDEKESQRIAQEKLKKKQQATSSTSTSSSSQQPPQRPPPTTTNPPRLRHILRRPWSSEEENTLVDALKETGPQWSKILELHGAGGSKSENLKNRTQVQLKDKARNWKMGYLKNNGQVPEYLSKVTGDLGDDRSQKKRKRESSASANANANGDSSKRPRSKSPERNVEQSRERVVQQESSIRTEKHTEKEQVETTTTAENPVTENFKSSQPTAEPTEETT